MIVAAALALALGVPQQADAFTYGIWQGRCFRDGYLAGMDHELCRASAAGPVAIRIERDAEALAIWVEPSGCRKTPAGGVVRANLLALSDRAAVVAAKIRGQVRIALKECRSKLRAPRIDQPAVAALLLQSDGLAPGKKEETRP
ncbi:hypothetical protein [Sphingomonas sp.]|uniref:hypothetical protein n=1 Tax=Sphingomonas sp. TaxID=28214 RepID=UPI001B1FD7A7|nr:hypothetical protein [Sphingomonas sp.]MBO9715159.1 hypothetical protein [Sphingomonas sp.]